MQMRSVLSAKRLHMHRSWSEVHSCLQVANMASNDDEPEHDQQNSSDSDDEWEDWNNRYIAVENSSIVGENDKFWPIFSFISESSGPVFTQIVMACVK